MDDIVQGAKGTLADTASPQKNEMTPIRKIGITSRQRRVDVFRDDADIVAQDQIELNVRKPRGIVLGSQHRPCLARMRPQHSAQHCAE